MLPETSGLAQTVSWFLSMSMCQCCLVRYDGGLDRYVRCVFDAGCFDFLLFERLVLYSLMLRLSLV